MINGKLSNSALLELATIITVSYNTRETNIDPDIKNPMDHQNVLRELTDANEQGFEELYEALECYGAGVIHSALYWEIADLVSALANPPMPL